MHPPESLRAFPPLSRCYAMRAGGRSQRTQAKRRLCGAAALARLPSPWQRHSQALRAVRSVLDNRR